MSAIIEGPHASGSEYQGDLDRLAQELGSFGFRWLIACAAFPALRLPITLHLGAALKRADGDPMPTEAEILALAALPWFRQGWMPDEWRDALLARQSPNDRDITRAALMDLAHTMITAPEADAVGAVTVARVTSAPKDFALAWQSWREGLSGPLADPDPALEALVAPRRLAGRRGVLALIAGNALGALGVTGGLWLRYLVPGSGATAISLSAIDPTGRFVALAYDDGTIARARADGSGHMETQSFGMGPWRGLFIGGETGSAVLAVSENGIETWPLDATLNYGTELGRVVRAEMSADGRVAVMLLADRSGKSKDWQLGFWRPPDLPVLIKAIRLPADDAIRIGVAGSNHFAVLADRQSIKLINIPDPKNPVQSDAASDDISPISPPNGLTTMAVSAAPRPNVAGALPSGELLIGEPGGTMEPINPGIGEIASLWIGERPGIIAPIWAAGAIDGRIALQWPDRVILAGHTGRIVSLAFSPDFRLLASASDDTTARVWRLVDGAALVLQTGGPLLRVAWVADQSAVVTVNADGRVRTWPIKGWPPLTRADRQRL